MVPHAGWMMVAQAAVSLVALTVGLVLLHVLHHRREAGERGGVAVWWVFYGAAAGLEALRYGLIQASGVDPEPWRWVFMAEATLAVAGLWGVAADLVHRAGIGRMGLVVMGGFLGGLAALVDIVLVAHGVHGVDPNVVAVDPAAPHAVAFPVRIAIMTAYFGTWLAMSGAYLLLAWHRRGTHDARPAWIIGGSLLALILVVVLMIGPFLTSPWRPLLVLLQVVPPLVTLKAFPMDHLAPLDNEERDGSSAVTSG